jgi:hypothetical protein
MRAFATRLDTSPAWKFCRTEHALTCRFECAGQSHSFTPGYLRVPAAAALIWPVTGPTTLVGPGLRSPRVRPSAVNCRLTRGAGIGCCDTAWPHRLGGGGVCRPASATRAQSAPTRQGAHRADAHSRALSLRVTLPRRPGARGQLAGSRSRNPSPSGTPRDCLAACLTWGGRPYACPRSGCPLGLPALARCGLPERSPCQVRCGPGRQARRGSALEAVQKVVTAFGKGH